MVEHETRRSTRIPIKIRIEAAGINEPVTCDGETVVVNRHGALISTTVALRLETKIEIHIIPTDKRARAHVVYVSRDSPLCCGIALDKPANVWGVEFPPADWQDDRSG